MYVNELTLDYGDRGRKAVQRLMDEAYEKRLIPSKVASNGRRWLRAPAAREYAARLLSAPPGRAEEYRLRESRRCDRVEPRERPLHPGLDVMTDFFIFLPHHDARITSGFRFSDFVSLDDPIFRQPLPAQLREDRFAARDLDELFDPLNAGDERAVPFFEEHARA